MKRIISLLLVFALLLPCMGLKAEAVTSGRCGQKLTWSFDTKTGTLTITGSGLMRNYASDGPSTSNKAPWSGHAAKILNVVISGYPTSIGDAAFKGCTNLKTVTIPGGVSHIGEYAFYGCKSLTSITIPDNVSYISENTFAYCENLTSVTILDQLYYVYERAFHHCPSLKDVYYPGSKAERERISIDAYNTDLTNATWHYNVLPPIQLQAVVKSATGKPHLFWYPIDGADFYRVYRKEAGDQEFSYLKSTRATSFTDTTAQAGVNYYYKVRAVLEETGKTTQFSNVANRCCDLPQPAAVAAAVNSATGKPKLTWEAVTGTQWYRIYRRTSSTDYTYLDSTRSTSFTDTTAEAGCNYFYQVKAVHKNPAANSARSLTANRACDLPRPVVTVGLKNGNPQITWEKISGAEKYRVYRADSKTGEYELVKSAITASSFTDTGAEAGKTYYYKVRALHSNPASNSAWSAVKSVTAK